MMLPIGSSRPSSKSLHGHHTAGLIFQAPTLHCLDNAGSVTAGGMLLHEILNLSYFNGHFPDGSGLAGTGTSPFWILLELRMMEVRVVTTVHAKLQSNHHHRQTNTQFFTGWMPSLSPNCVRALKENRLQQIIKVSLLGTLWLQRHRK